MNCEVFLYSFTFKSVEDLESLQGVKRRTREASSSIAPSRKTGGGKDASHPRKFSPGGERTNDGIPTFFPRFSTEIRPPPIPNSSIRYGFRVGWGGRLASLRKKPHVRWKKMRKKIHPVVIVKSINGRNGGT